MWSRRVIGETEREGGREWELPVGTDFSQNSRPYIVLKFPRNPHAMFVFYWSLLTPNAMLVFHWTWLTITRCLLFIGHALHPHIACFSLAMVYTHAMIVLHWSQLTPTHSLFLVIILLILSTAGVAGNNIHRFIVSQGDIS